jgi:hypothetical protein
MNANAAIQLSIFSTDYDLSENLLVMDPGMEICRDVSSTKRFAFSILGKEFGGLYSKPHITVSNMVHASLFDIKVELAIGHVGFPFLGQVESRGFSF